MPSEPQPARQDCVCRIRAKASDMALWEGMLFWFFALGIVLFPFGQFFRVLLPILCLVPLAVLYVKDWQGRNLRHLPVRWLWVVFFAVIALEIVGSAWVDVSWKSVRPNVFRGFVLVFAGMECIRGERELRRLVGVFALVCLVEGLSGVWQFATGADLLKGTKPMAYKTDTPFAPGTFESLMGYRLTGSMSTYRVGNFMALMLLPACGLFALWPEKGISRRAVWRAILTACLLAPGLFLWLGSHTRAGYMALAGGLYLTWMLQARPSRWFAVPPLIVAALVVLGPERISLARTLADERMHIWALAWDCFLHHPVLGTGASTFAEAAGTLGVTVLPTGHMVPPHPHNMYLQWLVDGGLVGFAGKCVWAFGMAVWCGRRIWQALHRPLPWDAAHATYWRLTAFFWAGWMGYLINGLAAHDFYRTWWVSAAFSVLGVLLGACAFGNRQARS